MTVPWLPMCLWESVVLSVLRDSLNLLRQSDPCTLLKILMYNLKAKDLMELRWMPMDNLEIGDSLADQERMAGLDRLATLEDLVCLESLVIQDLQDPSQIWNHSSTNFSNLQEKRDLHLIPFLTCKLKLDLWDLEDLLACKGPMVLKASKDLKVKLETQDLWDPLAPWVLEAFLVFLERMEKLDKTESLAHPDPLAIQEKEVCLACLDFLDLRATVASLALMGQRVLLVLQEKKENLVDLDQWDPLALLAKQDPEARGEGRDPQVLLDLEE